MLPRVNEVSKNAESMSVTYTGSFYFKSIPLTHQCLSLFGRCASHLGRNIVQHVFKRWSWRCWNEEEEVASHKKSELVFQLEIKIGSKHPFKHLLRFFPPFWFFGDRMKWDPGNCWAVLEVDQATRSTYWLEGPEEPWSSGQSGCLWSKRTWVWFQLRPNVFSLLGYKEVGIKWIQTQ